MVAATGPRHRCLVTQHQAQVETADVQNGLLPACWCGCAGPRTA